MRHMWGTCGKCNITVSWERSTDAGRDEQLPEEKLTFFECPSCGDSIHDGSDPTARWEQEDSKLIPALRRAVDAEKELRQRELHHFEEEQARAKAEGKVGVLLAALNVALNSEDENALQGARVALEEIRDEDLTLLNERDAAVAALNALVKGARLDQFTDGYVVVHADTRSAVRWVASLEDLAETDADDKQDEDEDDEETR